MNSEVDCRRHKQNVATLFGNLASGYDNAALRFSPFCVDQIVGILKPRPGQKVLDAASAFQPLRQKTSADLAESGLEPSHPHMASEKLTTPRECLDLMEPADLRDTGVQEKQPGYHLQSTEDWWTIIWDSGARRLIYMLIDDQRTQFRIKHTAQIQKLVTEKGF